MKRIFYYTIAFLFLTGCARPPSLFKETRTVMDTFAEIYFFSPDRKSAQEAMKKAFKEIERIEKLFSRYDEISELSNINMMAGKRELNISPELFKAIERSIYYSRLSEGSFDITVAPLVDIWRDARKDNLIPDAEVIEKALEYVGYKNIIMNRESSSIHFLDRRTKIDMGGMIKGYAVDKAKEILVSEGIENALINIGGNIFALGSPPGKKSWQIGIRHPRDKDSIIRKAGLKNEAVSTSGDYERFFILAGERFSHILDPFSGRPASNGIISVTVVSDSAELSDTLSTAIFVMGTEDGPKLIKSLKAAEVFIFNDDGRLIEYP